MKVFNKCASFASDVLRLRGELGWVNYFYSAPTLNRAELGRHILVFNPDEVKVPESFVTSDGQTVGGKAIKQAHFYTAREALAGITTLVGKVEEKIEVRGGWIVLLEGFDR